MSPHSGQGSRDRGVVEPKHRVFFSHSGAQKGFVEQLCVDLERCDRFPFFDKRRDSLPTGECFPPLIFEAIQQCQVGVVILSDDFFSSKWPMLELVEMIRTREKRPKEMKIMPIFLGISCGDLGDEKKLNGWVTRWSDFGSDERVNIVEWKSALRSLKGTNGLVYKAEVGEVKFREEIVEEIRKIVPPFHMWDDSHVQGRSRLSEGIREKISIMQSGGSHKVVGLYGVGGIGKSTACKSLCKDLYMEFHGRVCCIEFGNDTTEKDRLREVLKRLTDTSDEYFKFTNVDAWRSRLKGLMQQQRVFLAIDNVSDSKTIEEAYKYLGVGYCPGSIVMVTARGRGELKRLGIDDRDCLEMPELEADDARDLFLYYAQPKEKVDTKVLELCINRCHFGKGDGKSHYHPLALKVLGSQLRAEDPKKWGKQLGNKDTFNQGQERENPVFSILRSSFDNLMEEDKLLFMDVALFGTKADYKQDSDLNFGKVWNMFEWLGMVHGIRSEAVKKRLDGLKEKALLEELGDGRTQIGMHDLWWEFAQLECERGVCERRLGVYEFVNRKAEDSSLRSGGWKNLRRISLAGITSLGDDMVSSVKSLDFSYCSNVTVLKLVNVVVENRVLDLSPLRQLKSLEFALLNPWPLRDGYRVSGIGGLKYLTVLIWLHFGNFESVRVVEDICHLRSLQVLVLSSLNEDLSIKLDLGQLRWLRKVRLEIWGEMTISGLNSEMEELRILDLTGCWLLRSCPGVGDLIGLEELMFSNCRSLLELSNLQTLTNLQVLELSGCDSLQCIPGLGNLIGLRELSASDQLLIGDWRDRGKLTKLQAARIWGQEVEGLWGSGSEEDGESSPQELQPVVNLAGLESVSTLHLRGVKHELTNLSELTRLQDLEIDNCDFKTLSGLSNLTTLKRLRVEWCRLERLPDMGKHMTLESLTIVDCRDLEGWEGVGGLGSSESQTGVDLHCDWTLPHLVKLKWDYSAVVELPDLCHFPRLRELSLDHDGYQVASREFGVHCLANHLQLEILHCRYWPITVLPDLSKFPSLKELNLIRCVQLTSLSSSGPLTALEVLHLADCENLLALPDVNLFPGLRKCRIRGCGVTLNAQEIEELERRCSRLDVDEESWLESNPASTRIEIIPDIEPTYSGSGAPQEMMKCALDGPDDLQLAGSSLLGVEPSTSGFVPKCELGIVPVPKRVMEEDSSERKEESKKCRTE